MNARRSMNPAQRRYLLTFLPAMTVYAIAIFVISGWLGLEPPKAGFGLYLAALLPALPTGIAIYAIIRYVSEEPDEFLRMLQVKAQLIGLGLTLFVCTAWGFLAQYAHVWSLPLYLIFPMQVFFYGLAAPFVYRSYR